MRQAVRDLEPALMQLVLADPRFFSDREHPARRLLDEMTQRSLAFDSEAAPGFRDFLRVLRAAVDRLAAAPIADARPFEAALEGLQRAWAAQDAEELARREQAVQELLHAEQRNLLAEKIAADIRAWPDAAQVPDEVLAFATGPWSHVMAEARLGDRVGGASDPGGYAGVVPNLFWSARPDLARAAIPRLTRLIPGLLAKLREGLKTIDYPPQQASAFFERLIGLHQRAFQAGGPAGRQPPPAPPAAAAQPAAAAVSAAAASVAAEESAVAAAPAPAFALEVGAWVEILDHGRPARTQLTWTSPHGTLFLFTAADGSTRSMTRRMRDRLAAEGALRVVAGGAVVAGALDAVAQTALRNSIKPGKG
ncbi:MAG: hypothetical protein GAK38_00870 [Xylophilus sp.]|nr:MAG: hypothetical protein GAK38_00870 [Xylophilus sp.]